jgi:hypothetical protein
VGRLLFILSKRHIRSVFDIYIPFDVKIILVPKILHTDNILNGNILILLHSTLFIIKEIGETLNKDKPYGSYIKFLVKNIGEQ